MAFVSDFYVSAVEQTGVDMDVTVVIDGTVVVGSVTRMAEFQEWYLEQAGDMILPDGELVVAPEEKTPPEDGSVETYAWFCLRNATVHSGGPMNWPTLPYLVVAAAHVGAISPRW